MQLSARYRTLAVLLPLFCPLACSSKPAALERSASFLSALSPRRVTGTVRLRAPVLVHIVTDTDRLITTPEHPFATLHGGWVPAGKLAPGDVLLRARAGEGRVVAVHREELVQPVPVFNLTVATTHAYLVGSDEVLVHNVRCTRDQAFDIVVEKTERVQRKIWELDQVEQTHAVRLQLIELEVEYARLRHRQHKLAPRRNTGPLQFRDTSWRQREGRELGIPTRYIRPRVAIVKKHRDVLKQLALDERALQNPKNTLDEEREKLRKLGWLPWLFGKGTKALYETIAELKSKHDDAEVRLRQERLLASVLERRASVPAPGNDAYLRDLENELDGSPPVGETRLSELERKLGLETIRRRGKRPLAEDILRETESRKKRLKPEALAEMAGVDDAVSSIVEYLEMLPSPERMAGVHSSIERLRGELNEERQLLQFHDTMLGEEQRALMDTREPAESSTVDEQLEAIQDERTRLRDDWQEVMQDRLSEAQRLRDSQSTARVRDEAVEGELARLITLYENELASFRQNSEF
jgi:Pretoxin HINT domain